jgi:hypothetical protein
MPATGPDAPPGECRADERKQTDRYFRQCIAQADHRVLSELYYMGVRLGGTPYLPTPWRWGFGWNYPHGYESLCEPATADGSLSLPAGAFR